MPDIKTALGFRTHVQENRYSILRQPVVSLHDGAVLHSEWLVRFDAKTGLDHVLRPAEISGAISDLDLSMLGHAVQALNKNGKRGAIAVNLSGASIADPDFEFAILSVLSGLKTPAEKLIFELTETWDIKNLLAAARVLNILRERGHPLCLDDVGAGAASLRYLRALPADWLKIDGDFVAGAAKNEQEHAVLRAVLSLRDDLNVKFIAEGIETEQLRQFAQEAGFDAVQGFAICPPEPVKL